MSAPVVFKFPADGYQTVLALGLFLYVDQAAPGTLGASIRNAVGGQRVLDWIRMLTVLAHVGEAIAMLVVCVKRGAPLLTLLKWVATTFVVGYPSWISFSAVNKGIW